MDISLARRGSVVQLLPHEGALVLRSTTYMPQQTLVGIQLKAAPVLLPHRPSMPGRNQASVGQSLDAAQKLPRAKRHQLKAKSVQ